jgi:putative ABC transport system permease protein
VFLAWRDLRAARGRFLLVGAVVGLISLMSTLLSGLATGLVDDGISGLRALPLTHLAFQRGAESNFARSTLDVTNYEMWLDSREVEATPVGVTFFTATTPSGASIDLALFGLPPDSYLALDLGQRGALAGGGLVLNESAAELGLGQGDPVFFAGADQSVPVAGFAASGSYGHQDIGFTSLQTWQQLVYDDEAKGRYSAIAIRAADGTDLAAVDAIAGTETQTKEQSYQGSPGFAAETATMTLIRAFLLAISSLVVGAFFTVWTVQRSAQIGLMKALGASNLYVLRDALGQLAVMMLASTVLGASAGVGLGHFVGSEVPFNLRPGPILVSAGALIVLGMAGSLVAIRRITAVDPIVALGGAH